MRDNNNTVTQKGHTQENSVNTKSPNFQDCHIDTLIINLSSHDDADENQISFKTASSGNITNTQVMQLPDNVDTIVEVVKRLRAEGIEPTFALPEKISVPAIEHQKQK